MQILKWPGRILLFLLAALVVLLVVLAFIPVPSDPPFPPEQWGVGAPASAGVTGLQRQFPPSNEPADNPTTPARVELGRALFFDPVLSAKNDLSCATCHNPDLGFTDGLSRARGANGVTLPRNALTLWNVAFEQSFFWDGREKSLEAQVMTPLTHADEMGVSDTNALAAKLRAIPEYVTLFDKAFGGGDKSITVENLTRALAAFERTLVTNDSPFDKYAAGNLSALTPAQRRGLTLFRSAATRCFECHQLPTFASNTYRLTGVPDGNNPHDAGRAAAVTGAQDGAFRVPTLRNIALTAPYMHNGVFKTLDEVIDFYAQGGGRAQNVANVDNFVRKFNLTAQEKQDLINFLYALTDESRAVAIPARVPSGLPVVAQANNPGRVQATQVLEANKNLQANSAHAPTTLRVQAGETIQTAVDRALPGDIIEVPYGIYNERVVIDFNRITVRGLPNDKNEWPVLDGQGKLADGLISSGNDFELANFQIKNYTDNGVLVEGATNVYLHDLYTENTGIYGLYPVQSTNVKIERVRVTGVIDAGVYVGQSKDIIVRDCEAWGNVIGIELENTVNAEVYNNHVYSNTVGLSIVLLPTLTAKVSRDIKVHDNISENNNKINNARVGGAARGLPTGVGLLHLGTKNSDNYHNTFRGNKSGGVAVYNVKVGFGNTLDVPPTPENNWVHENQYANNGFDADPLLKKLGVPGSDIVWDGSGWGNRFDETKVTMFPPLLPTSSWWEPLTRVYIHVLNFLTGLL